MLQFLVFIVRLLTLSPGSPELPGGPEEPGGPGETLKTTQQYCEKTDMKPSQTHKHKSVGPARQDSRSPLDSFHCSISQTHVVLVPKEPSDISMLQQRGVAL